MQIPLAFLSIVACFSQAALAKGYNEKRYVGPRQNTDAATQQQRADAVKQTFQIAWNGYKQYAFPNDELHPVTNAFSDSRNGWGASVIDAFSTALIMEDAEIVDFILNHIPSINFDQTAPETPSISLFESTIRYIAGLLSGYDLLTGPLSNLASNGTQVQAILAQARHLADNLKFAFNTPTGIPHPDLFINGSNGGSPTNSLTSSGSLVLEWTRLSDITGDPQYASLAQKGESFLLNPQPASSEPFPGLSGTRININTGLFEDANGGWGGGDDSFYEYLIKMYVYDPVRFGQYKDRWILAADSSIANLTSHPLGREDLTFLASFQSTNLTYQSGHLACFAGGNFLLGGSVLKQQKYIDFGLDLVNGCHDTYISTATRIGPEGFGWLPTPFNNVTQANLLTSTYTQQEAFYAQAGFYITNDNYILRPEVLESYYYAWRITGDPKYREWAWDAFTAINATCRTGSGYAELMNVNEAGGGGFYDFQDSFFFAEVLKYSYLIQTDDNSIFQVDQSGNNQFVFNTEAHPLKVFGGASNASVAGTRAVVADGDSTSRATTTDQAQSAPISPAVPIAVDTSQKPTGNRNGYSFGCGYGKAWISKKIGGVLGRKKEDACAS